MVYVLFWYVRYIPNAILVTMKLCCYCILENYLSSKVLYIFIAHGNVVSEINNTTLT